MWPVWFHCRVIGRRCKLSRRGHSEEEEGEHAEGAIKRA